MYIDPTSRRAEDAGWSLLVSAAHGVWNFAIPLSVAVMMMFGMFDIRCP
jgi:hypothetical protein